MNKEPDISGQVVPTGVDEETIARLREEGVVHVTHLPEGAHPFTREDQARLREEGGVPYGPMPEGLLKRLADETRRGESRETEA